MRTSRRRLRVAVVERKPEEGERTAATVSLHIGDTINIQDSVSRATGCHDPITMRYDMDNEGRPLLTVTLWIESEGSLMRDMPDDGRSWWRRLLRLE